MSARQTPHPASGRPHTLRLPGPRAGSARGVSIVRGSVAVQAPSQSWAPGTGPGGHDYVTGGVRDELGPLNSHVEVLTHPNTSESDWSTGLPGARGGLPPGRRSLNTQKQETRPRGPRQRPPAPGQSRPRDRPPDLSQSSDTEPSTEREAGVPSGRTPKRGSKCLRRHVPLSSAQGTYSHQVREPR